jgi:hypothetical protein
VTLAELRGGHSGDQQQQQASWLKGLVGEFFQPFVKSMERPPTARLPDPHQYRQVTVIRSGKEESVHVEAGRSPQRIGPDLANTDPTDAIKTPGGGN